MRRWIPLALLGLALLVPELGNAAATKVQSCSGLQGAGASASCSLTVTNGNAIAIYVGSYASGGLSFATVSDGVNTYTTPASCADEDSADPRAGFRYALGVTGGSLTFTFTPAFAGVGWIVVHEIQDVDSFDVCVGSAGTWNGQTAPGTGETATSTSGTITAGDYLFVATVQACCSGGSISLGTNYTGLQSLNDSGFIGAVEYRENAPGGSLAGKFTLDSTAGAGDYKTAMMAFKSSAGGAATLFFQRRLQQ